MNSVVPITVQLTTKDIDDINRDGNLSSSATNRLLAFIITSVKNHRPLEPTDSSVKKVKAVKKTRKPRIPTAFNIFSQKHKDDIKAQMGEGKHERGAFTKKAGEMWKSMTDEQKAQYQPSTTILVNSKLLPATDKEVKQFIKAAKAPKDTTKKPTKARGPTPFNRYVKSNKSIIKSQMGDGEDAKARGAFIKKASEMWKAMTDEQKAEYNEKTE